MNMHGYVRVALEEDNNLERQREILMMYGVPENKINCEVISGFSKIHERPKMTMLMENLTRGDILVVANQSRISRNMMDMINVANEMKGSGITLICLDNTNKVVDCIELLSIALDNMLKNR